MENCISCPVCRGRIYGFDELVADLSGEIVACINCVEQNEGEEESDSMACFVGYTISKQERARL